MIRTPISYRKKLFLNIMSVVILIVGYIIVAHHQSVINPGSKIIPTIIEIKTVKNADGTSHRILDSQIGSALIGVLTPDHRSGERWLIRDSEATLFRLIIAFVIATSSAFVLGLSIGCYTWIEAIFDWPITFLSKITPTGALSVFFVLFGTETKMFVAMIVFGILPAMIQSIVIAVKQFPEDLQNKGYSVGSSNSELVLTLIFRYVLPNIIDAIRACIGPAMIFLIAAETLCADVGFGSTIRQQSRLTNMDIVFVYLTTLAIFGFVIDYILKTFQVIFCNWYVKGNK